MGRCGSTDKLELPSPPQKVGWVSQWKQDCGSQNDPTPVSVTGADPKSAIARADQSCRFLTLGHRLARLLSDT